MTFFAWIFRIFSFVYHVPLAVFLLAVGLFGVLDGATNMKHAMLPWSGRTLVHWLLGLGAIGVVTAVLAMRGKLKPLFALYAAGMFGLVLNGVTTQYHGSMDAFQGALWFLGGALAALLGAVAHVRAK